MSNKYAENRARNNIYQSSQLETVKMMIEIFGVKFAMSYYNAEQTVRVVCQIF